MDEDEQEILLTADERAMLVGLCREHADKLGKRHQKPKDMTIEQAFREFGMASRLAEILAG